MGSNQQCCSCNSDPKMIPLIPGQDFHLSTINLTLSDKQHEFINSRNPFPQQHSKVGTLKCGNDLFYGQIDEQGKPKGFGILQNSNCKSIFVGIFNGGFTEKDLYFVLQNGSYFYGNLNSEDVMVGRYENPQKNYQLNGEFTQIRDKQIRFIPNGKGSELSERYTFEGTFQKGRRMKGKLNWYQLNFKCQYEGSFDQKQQFTGIGVLKEQTGTYTGDFKQGLKHGKGRYQFATGLLYDGEYKEGKKNGIGKLFNSDGSLCYEGQLKDGLPHGIGTAYWQAMPNPSQFIQGISKDNHVELQHELTQSGKGIEK